MPRLNNKENYNGKPNIEDNNLSEYEKIRLHNIQERQKLFEELRITEAKHENIPVAKTKIISKRRRDESKTSAPVRKSLRLAGGVPEIDRFSAGLDDNPPDESLATRPKRRIAPENYNDYLHVTRTFSGNETPDTLAEVHKERFRILQVPKRCTIKQFVLSNNLEFKVGRGFYEFTKPEIISHRKEVVLVDKKTGQMFTGKDACRMINGKNSINILL